MAEERRPSKLILAILFAFVFLDVLGFSIVLPLLPFIVVKYNVNSAQIGWLVASNAIAQFVAAPVLGKLSDTFGRRRLLLLCAAGTFLSFGLLSQANTFEWVVMCRVFDGLLGGDISLAQTYISDITSDSYRTHGMGILGAALGLGFIFGPAIGATLSPNFDLAIYTSCALAFFNFWLIFIFLPESYKPNESKNELFPFRSVLLGIQNVSMRPILISRFAFGLILTSFETYIGLFLLHEFEFQPRSSGIVLTFFALIYAFSQSPRVVSRTQVYSEKQIIVGSFVSLFLANTLWAISGHPIVIILAIIPLSVGSGLVNPLLSSIISRLAGPNDRGGFLGLSASIGSLTRIVAPVLGGHMIDYFGNKGPPVLCALLSIVVAVYISRTLQK